MFMNEPKGSKQYDKKKQCIVAHVQTNDGCQLSDGTIDLFHCHHIPCIHIKKKVVVEIDLKQVAQRTIEYIENDHRQRDR